jgi:hypothetical protein
MVQSYTIDDLNIHVEPLAFSKSCQLLKTANAVGEVSPSRAVVLP